MRIILLFFIFFCTNTLATDSADFFRFKERFHPQSKADMPPSSEVLEVFNQLSEMERYFFLQRYFTAEHHTESIPPTERTILLYGDHLDLEKLQSIMPLGFKNAFPQHKTYEIIIPEFYKNTEEYVKLIQKEAPQIHIEMPAKTGIYLPSSVHKGCDSHHLVQIEWTKALDELKTRLPNRQRKITVAVFDTGIANHFALRRQTSTSFSIKPHGHGSHVAGIIAAKGEENGLQGLAADSVILKNYAVLDKNGQGNIVDLISALIKAEQEGCQIMNFSLALPHYSQILYDLLSHLAKKGIIIVAAAGNEASDEPVFPAAHPLVIGVGALDAQNIPTNFSNYGINANIFLPGENICSIWPPDTMKIQSGTSMAAPVLTGLLAEFLSRATQIPAPYKIIESIAKYNQQYIKKDQGNKKPFSANTFLELLLPHIKPDSTNSNL